MAKSAAGVVRTRRLQSACTTTQLQKMAPQYAKAYGPVGRSTSIMYISYGLPLYQAMKASTRYEYVTIQPVTSNILAMLSRWFFVTTLSSLKTARAGTMSVTTIANPE